jgi:hypothetical protein
VGRVVLYEDAAHSFFSTIASPNFSGFSPSDPTTTWSRGEILETLDLPLNVTVGLGGVAAPALAAPYDLITASACSFCDSSGDGRGAVVFDSRGRALFYTASGAALAAWGGTLALQGPTSIAGYRMVIITTATGSVRTINNG